MYILYSYTIIQVVWYITYCDFDLWPANQPAITVVTLFHKKIALCSK
jgi:hypothetical protein